MANEFDFTDWVTTKCEELLKDIRYTDQRVKSTTSVVRKCRKYLPDNFASFTVLHRVAMASYTHVANIWEVEAHGQHEFSAKIHQKLCSWCEKMSSNIETNVHFDTFSSSCFLSQHFDYGRDVWFMSWCSKLCTLGRYVIQRSVNDGAKVLHSYVAISLSRSRGAGCAMERLWRSFL